jgi:uncharacterized protein YbjT (DUF2867 family)
MTGPADPVGPVPRTVPGSLPTSPSTATQLEVAVTGANGFVGARLVARLSQRGFPVRALVRDPDSVTSQDGVEVREADASDPDQMVDALDGCTVAYYLIHAMAAGEGFAERDLSMARSFARSAEAAGIERIVYLGGLGHGELSEHLTSRQEVGEVLGSTGLDVVELRAAVVIGAGSISFEMLRYLTERLPAMVCPTWVATLVQPIGVDDLLGYLVEAMGVEPGIYEIGSPDVTSYREMMDAYARVRRLKKRLIVRVPVLSPSLSARWVDLVTPVDRTVSHSLIESLGNEVTVRDRDRTDAAFTIRPLASEEAVKAALDQQADEVAAGIFDLPPGLRDGVYTDRSHSRVRTRSVGPGGVVAGVERDLDDCGGQLSWYGWPYAWQLRIAIGHPFGEDLRLGRPGAIETGGTVDWWTVEERASQTLVLSTRNWFCGEAWLGFRVSETHPVRIEQVGALRTRGLTGFAYWWLLWPIHQVAFRAMVHHRTVRARRMARRTSRHR